jgi:hypothetical protein
VTREQAAKLHACLDAMPGGHWEVWTSNSYRRITAVIGRRSQQDGGVLHAYNQASDGHPDLSMSELELKALCELRNTVAEMLDRVE